MSAFLRGRRTLLVGVLALLLAAIRPAGAARPDAPANLDPIYVALKDDPALRGAWVSATPAEGPPPVWVLELSVDEGRTGDAQHRALVKVIKDTLPPGRYKIAGVKRYPVSRLIASVQDRAEDEPLLRGCLIQGAFFSQRARAKDYEIRVLNLFGRIRPGLDLVTTQRRERLMELCSYFVEKDPAWRELLNREPPLLVVDAEGKEFQPEPYAERAGNMHYQNGLALRRSCRYSEAARAFQLALTEDPDSLVYIYWRAVSEIDLGNNDKAFRLLCSAVAEARHFEPLRTADVARALERLQGPVRATLADVEARAWADAGSLPEPPPPKRLPPPKPPSR
jgi:hypothetical protein